METLTRKEFNELKDSVLDAAYGYDATTDAVMEFVTVTGKTVFVTATVRMRKVVEYTETYMGIEYYDGGYDLEGIRICDVEVFDKDGVESYRLTAAEILEMENHVKRML